MYVAMNLIGSSDLHTQSTNMISIFETNERRDLLLLGEGVERGQERGHEVLVHVLSDGQLRVDEDLLGLLDGVALRLAF